MFNSPILDTTLGLVFIFLLYSLLATSINEAIATLFGLRARMLRNAIVDHMLSNASRDTRMKSFWKGVVEFIMAIPRLFIGHPKGKEKIGDQFYDHAIIKKYGATRMYSLPSYLTAANFAAIVIDLLKKDFDQKADQVAPQARAFSPQELTKAPVQQNPKSSPDIVKVKQLIQYYRNVPDQPDPSADPQAISSPASKGLWNALSSSKAKPKERYIDSEVLDSLEILLEKSKYDWEAFQKYLESWFNDTMERVTGWYKRQTQTILFILGIVMAIAFNVDTITLTNKLSSNTDTRKILVDRALAFADQHEQLPRIIVQAQGDTTSKDTTQKMLSARDSLLLYQAMVDSIYAFKQKEIDTVNSLLALGWGDYGLVRDSAKILSRYFAQDSVRRQCDALPPIYRHSTAAEKLAWLRLYYAQHWFKTKVCYVLNEIWSLRRIIGFLITAFAISLGAPFWFDMLNKIVRIRGTGAKQTSEGSVGDATVSASTQPIIINNRLTEEAQG